MIDLHTHTFLSDGNLTPSELVYRARVHGYKAIALTDHVDFSNIDFVIGRVKRITEGLRKNYDIFVIPGAEITYVPPKLIGKAVKLARKLGARLVVVHGETPAETVPPGTNRAGILAGADIIAHPGYITLEDALLARKKNVYLEITSRKGHNKTDRHVAITAKKARAKMVLNSDTHRLENLLDKKKIKNILRKSGLNRKDFKAMQDNAWKLLARI